MNYRDFLQKVIYAIINPLIKGMIAVGITPNIVTFVGFLGNIVAAGFFLDAAWMLGTEQADYASCMVTVGWGGFIILAAGLFDMMDGRLARMSGKSSLFGALWDSTLDRYSELVSLFGICLIFVRMQGDMIWFWMSVVTFAAMIGSVMVSYVRARAEGLDIECKVGFMQRPRCGYRCYCDDYRLYRQYLVAGWRNDSDCRSGKHHRFLAHLALLCCDERS